MKRKVIILALLTLVFSLVFSSCSLLSGDKAVTRLTIVDGTFSYTYEVGDTPDLSKIKVQADYNDGSSKVLSKDDLTITAIDTATAGTKQVTITYSGVSITVDVKVESKHNDVPDEPEVTLTGIAIDASSVAGRVIKGTALDTTAIKVIATYSDNTTKNLTAADLASISTVDTATAGEKTLIVTYGEKTATLKVNVVEVTAIQVVGTAGITVMQNGTISTEGITAFATYSDGVIETVANEDLTFDVPATTEAGAKVITVTYRGATATIPVTVKAPATVIGIEVDYNSIKDYTVVADGTQLNMDAIKENIVVYTIWGYVDGGTAQIEKREAVTDKTLITITETNDTTRYITVKYGDFTQNISISETAAIVTGIEITAYEAGVKIGKTYDTSKIAITVTYSNGATENVVYGAAGLTASAIDTATAGTVTLTVSYAGKSDTAEVTVYGVTSVVPVGTAPTGIIGETLSFSDMTFLVTYADNDTETVSVSEVTITGVDTSTAGDKTATVTYLGKDGTISYKVKGVKSVSIGSITTRYEIGTPFSYETIVITVIYTDDTTTTFNAENGATAGVTFNTSGIDISKAGSYNFTVTYKGVTSEAVQISYKEVGYEIVGVSEPGSITKLDTNKKYYLNPGYGYLVGDDNAFKYSLVLSAYDLSGNKVTITKYTSKSLVYIVEGGGDTILNEAKERLLEGDELALYVSIDEANNAFDFTEEAIGKTFKIVTRPAYGITPDESEADPYAEYTRTHTFTVVDAYNVYEAKQLHVITNTDDINETVANRTQLAWSQSMLGAYSDIPASINGIVLHNDIKITTGDLPSQFFVDGDREKNLNDYTALFVRDMAKGDFTIHGNYFTIYSYLVPPIPDNGNGTNNSHSELFRFLNSARSTTFDYSEYDLRIENLYILDNDPNDPLNVSSVRSRLGLIGMKIANCDAVLDNIVAERYYITILGEYDNTALTINQSKLYNSWQNHILLWSKNGIDDKDSEPSANHVPLKLDVFNSKITTCGGPIIISQTAAPDENRNKNSGADVTIDEATEINTYVTADSVWFSVMGATPYATQIIGLNALMPSGTTYVTTKLPDGTEAQFLNMVMVTLVGTENINDILNSPDVDGSLTINGELVSTMDDDSTLIVNVIKSIIASQVGAAKVNEVPILQSSNGGWAYIGGSDTAPEFFDLEATIEAVLAQQGITIDIPAFAPGDSGYITLYYMGMAIVLDDYRVNQ